MQGLSDEPCALPLGWVIFMSAFRWFMRGVGVGSLLMTLAFILVQATDEEDVMEDAEESLVTD